MSEVQSPCVEICQLDPVSGMCLGCFRTMDEIATWIELTDIEKQSVLLNAQKRKSEMFDR
jgi:predicted Fe-S protein YdhL (DUF1289 family)